MLFFVQARLSFNDLVVKAMELEFFHMMGKCKFGLPMSYCLSTGLVLADNDLKYFCFPENKHLYFALMCIFRRQFDN